MAVEVCLYCLIDACNKCLKKDCACIRCGRRLGPVERKLNAIVQSKGAKKRGPIIEFAWGEPPGRLRMPTQAARLRPALEALVEQPGEWARIGRFESSTRANLAKRAAVDAGFTGYEFRSRRADETGYYLWARYMPEVQA